MKKALRELFTAAKRVSELGLKALGEEVADDGRVEVGQFPLSLSPIEAFVQTIKQLVADKIISRKQDFGIILRLDQEMGQLGFVGYEDICSRLNELVTLPTQLQPTANSIKVFSFGSKTYPNWNLDSKELPIVSHIRAVANGYIREMSLRGFMHPSLKQQAL